MLLRPHKKTVGMPVCTKWLFRIINSLVSYGNLSANFYWSLQICMWVALDVYNRIFFGGKQKSLGGARYATTPISAYREYAKNSKSPILCSNIMIDVDLYVFDDDKSNKNGFKSIKPSYIPLLPHKCHFSCHARPVNRKKWNIQV